MASVVSLSACVHYPKQLSKQDSSDLESRVCLTSDKNGAIHHKNIHVLTWNVFKGRRAGWDQELNRFDQTPTLFLIQEAPFNLVKGSILEKNQYLQYAKGIKTRIQTGVINSSSASSTLSCQLQHLEPWLRTPKASLITRYPFKNSEQQLLVANIHAVNFTLGTRYFSHQLRDIVTILALHKGPIIFAGDFNTWNPWRLSVLKRYISELNLKRVSFDINKVKSFAGHPLDYVFYRDLTVLNHSVLEVDSSDHHALFVEFSL